MLDEQCILKQIDRKLYFFSTFFVLSVKVKNFLHIQNEFLALINH